MTSTLGVQSRRCAAVCGPPPTSSSSLSTASPSPSARSSFLIRRRCRFARSCPRAVNVLNFACQCCRVVGTWSIAWQMAAGGVQWRDEQYETHVELPVGCCSCIVNASDTVRTLCASLVCSLLGAFVRSVCVRERKQFSVLKNLLGGGKLALYYDRTAGPSYA